jgi:hypothetical protein
VQLVPELGVLLAAGEAADQRVERARFVLVALLEHLRERIEANRDEPLRGVGRHVRWASRGPFEARDARRTYQG